MREIAALLTLFLPLSLLSFGGGASILAPMHDATVQQYGWLTPREFVDYFAISRASPGPGAMLVTLVGWKVAGWAGAIVATIAIFLPSSIVCYLAAHAWNRHRGTRLHTALERGLVPIGTGLSISGAILVLRLGESGLLGWIVAIVATALVMWRNLHPSLILALGGAVFVAFAWAAG
ncbi:MAG: chromate transporter [Hyphomicrobiaceae bacterium]